MAVISRLQIDHPALGEAGGATLHAKIQTLLKKMGDSITSRWFVIEDFDNGEVVDSEHNFDTAIANLRYDLYVANGTNEADTTVWPSGATANQGDYAFLQAVDGTTFAIWLNKDGAGVAPSGAYYRGATHKIQVDILSGDSASSVALKARNAVVANSQLTSRFLVGARSVDTFSFYQLSVGSVPDAFTKDASDSGAGTISLTVSTQGAYNWTRVTDSSSPNLADFTFAATPGSTDTHLRLTNVSGGNNLTVVLAVFNDPVQLDELTDVTITAPAAGQVLGHNGTGWVNVAPPASPNKLVGPGQTYTTLTAALATAVAGDRFYVVSSTTEPGASPISCSQSDIRVECAPGAWVSMAGALTTAVEFSGARVELVNFKLAVNPSGALPVALQLSGDDANVNATILLSAAVTYQTIVNLTSTAKRARGFVSAARGASPIVITSLLDNAGSACHGIQVCDTVQFKSILVDALGSGGIRSVGAANTSVSASEHGLVLLMTNNASPRNINLPATPNHGFLFTVKQTDGNTGSTLVRAGGEYIEGLASNFVLNAPYGAYTFIYDGVTNGWWRVA